MMPPNEILDMEESVRRARTKFRRWVGRLEDETEASAALAAAMGALHQLENTLHKIAVRQQWHRTEEHQLVEHE